MSLSKEEVRHIAELARIGITTQKPGRQAS